MANKFGFMTHPNYCYHLSFTHTISKNVIHYQIIELHFSDTPIIIIIIIIIHIHHFIRIVNPLYKLPIFFSLANKNIPHCHCSPLPKNFQFGKEFGFVWFDILFDTRVFLCK